MLKYTYLCTEYYTGFVSCFHNHGTDGFTCFVCASCSCCTEISGVTFAKKLSNSELISLANLSNNHLPSSGMMPLL